ncbi:MAG: CRISPR system precrRNA processing endoribonuclease RAMP protein Cas6 [Methanotrichaceae archaeon]
MKRELKNLELARYEASIRFSTAADLPLWSGNVLRSGFGARLKEMVCLSYGGRGNDCSGCPQIASCAYDFFYNSHPIEGAKVLRNQEIPRPFAFEPPKPGRYRPGDVLVLGFTLIGKGMSYLPYFLLALRDLGKKGMSLGFREGKGKFDLVAVGSIGYGARSNIFQEDTVYNRSIILGYKDMVEASEEHSGNLSIHFITPTQIKENGRFTAVPSFRGFMGRLISRANALAEFYGSGMLYDHDGVLTILSQCRAVSIASARTEEIWMERRFHDQGPEKKLLAPFFKGEIAYFGEFSREIMALLELGKLIHIGKMATFGNGSYEISV